jgi:hypothetical protein
MATSSWIGACALLVGLGSGRTTPPHPLHTTMTEIVHEGQVITMTVRGFADDLTLAAGRSSDSAIAFYLQSRVRLFNKRGSLIAFEWKRTRRAADVVFTTFEGRLNAGLGGSLLVNRALWEVHPDQVNLVQVRGEGRRQSLLFSPNDAPQTIR